MEVKDVKDTRQWERDYLAEEGKYDPDDDSSDEEAIAARAERQRQKDLAEQLAAEQQARAAEQAKGAKKK